MTEEFRVSEKSHVGLRVLMIVPGALDNSGGVELSAIRLIEGLRSNGTRVETLWRKRREVEDNRQGSIKDFGLPGPAERLIFGFRASWKAARRRDIDVIHVQGSEYGWALPIFIRLFGAGSTKIVVTSHGSMSRMLTEVGSANKLNKRLYIAAIGYFERLVYKVADVVCVVSEHILEDIGPTKTNCKISVIPNAVETAIFKSNAIEHPPADRYLIWTGRKSAYKNPEALIRAFTKVQESHPEIRLIVVGDTLWSKSVQIENRGRVAQEELAGLIRNAYALLSTSFYEGDPLSVKEALASGVPVVVTAAASQGVKHGSNGLIVDRQLRNDGDILAFASEVKKLLEDEGLRARLAAGARESASDLKPEVEQAGYRDVYQQI